MARTSASTVQSILGDNYDGSTDVSPFIDTATAVVDRLSALDTDSVLSASVLELIERWLAAHYYAHMDQLKASEGRGKSNADYQGQYGMDFKGTKYGQAALGLDFTGNLASLGKAKIKFSWLGLVPSEQTDHEDRD